MTTPLPAAATVAACHEYYQDNAKGEHIAHARVYRRLGRLWLTGCVG